MDKRKRRLIELGKDLLIAALTCSAVYLGGVNLMAAGLNGLLHPPDAAGPSAPQAQESSAIAWPVRMAVSYWNGDNMRRQGVQYDQAGCEQLFQPAASLLREALGSAGPAQAVSQREWRQVLGQSSNLYFDFLGDIPLSVLSGWLSGEEVQLEGTVRRLVLAARGGQAALYYRDRETGGLYARRAEVVSADQLEAAALGAVDNGAVFAFEQEQYALLDGDTMILPQQPQPRVYAAANPLAGEGEEGSLGGRMGELLSALSFPENSYIYSGTDGQVIRSGSGTLRVYSGGTVTYSAVQGESSRYLVPSQGTPTRFEAAEACRQLAERAAGALAGAARLYLREMEQTAGGWRVDFGYCLDGTQVQVGEAGYAASFLVEGGEITQFTLQLRCYTDTERRSIVLPERLAAAALEPLDRQGGELLLAYWDTGGEAASAGWAAPRTGEEALAEAGR